MCPSRPADIDNEGLPFGVLMFVLYGVFVKVFPPAPKQGGGFMGVLGVFSDVKEAGEFYGGFYYIGHSVWN